MNEPDNRIVIIGAGPVGMYLARRLAIDHSVVVVDAEPQAPAATEERAYWSKSGATIVTAQPAVPASLSLRCGQQVTAIDRVQRQVVMAHGETLRYDQLVLALGAAPIVPAPFRQAHHVITTYEQKDFQHIERLARDGAPLLLLGGGVQGVELAFTLASKTSVTLLSRRALLARVVDVRVSGWITQQLRRAGVNVIFFDQLALESDTTDGLVCRVNEQRLVGAALLLTCGSVARVNLAREAGLQVNHGICVDASGRTSDRYIMAVGDCAEWQQPWRSSGLANGFASADRVFAALQQQPLPSLPSHWQLRINLGAQALWVAKPSPEEATQPLRAAWRGYWRGGFLMAFAQHRLSHCQALLPLAIVDRLAGYLTTPALPWYLRILLRMGVVPPPVASSDVLVCRCAGVSRARFLAALATHEQNLDAAMAACGAGQYCGACRPQLIALAGGKSVSSKRSLWVAIGLCLVVLGITQLPLLGRGNSIQSLTFLSYQALTLEWVRYASGIGLLVLLLSFMTPWRWHRLLGGLAIGLLPLHTLGGLAFAGQWNRWLMWAFVVCALSGAIAVANCWGRLVRRWHVPLGVVLLALILVHVVFVVIY